jgi:hypothetical protein
MRKRPTSAAQRRQALQAAEVPQFTPSKAIEALRDPDVGAFSVAGRWQPPARLTEDVWRRVGDRLRANDDASAWAWGDWWLNRGSRELPAHWSGPSRSTLDNRASVARAFPVSRQRETVSLSHHAELTTLSEADQDALLDWCETQEMQFRAGKSTVYPSVLVLREERNRRAAAKLSPPHIEPPRVTPPPAAPARIEPPGDAAGRPATD